jgi:hypothetical protein
MAAVAAVITVRIKNRIYASGLDFAAYGDCRHRPAIHAEICKALVAAAPRFVISTGDMVDDADRPEEWAVWEETTRELRARSRLYCAPGNHDLGPGKLFQKTVGNDLLFFDRREGDIHLFILDSSVFPEPAQLEWLEKTAWASTARHKIAVFHIPPFSIGPTRAAQMAPLQTTIHPLLVKLKFCAAFCGHQHGYYTTVRDGLRYVVTAGGGAPLWNLDPAMGLPSDQSRKIFHFTGFKFAGSKILGHVYDRFGVEEVDLRFTLCDHP